MNKMYSIERISGILKILERNGRVEVNELSTLYKASRETIRRDLREMEQKGLIKRTHGGAIFNSAILSTTPEFPVGVREIQSFQEKNAICKIAANFINNGDSIFADNSSTCLYLLQYIPADLKITLITNSIKLLLGSMESNHGNFTSICLGGFFNGSNLSTYGNLSLRNAADFYPDKSFMSCAGIRLPDQLTDSSILEVDTKRLMIERSREVFILADYTKFERSGSIFLSNFSSIDYLVTDQKTDPRQIALLETAGVKVLRAEDNYVVRP
jgi:DeoR family transcriptional regulator, fructose operon transcriptional repressor